MSQCRSLRRVTLHREGFDVYLRCLSGDGHPGRTHRSPMLKWKDETEDGWIEEEYDTDEGD